MTVKVRQILIHRQRQEGDLHFRYSACHHKEASGNCCTDKCTVLQTTYQRANSSASDGRICHIPLVTDAVESALGDRKKRGTRRENGLHG